MKQYTKEEIKKGSKYVPIEEIAMNDWNPKAKRTEEYYKVKQSVELNGQVMPVIVREKENDNFKYEILDGEQRFTAMQELGFDEVWIVNLGKVSDIEAKSTTIWMEQAVPFDDELLSELLVELQGEVELPFTDEEIELITGTLPTNPDSEEEEDKEESEGSLYTRFGMIVSKRDVEEIKEMHKILSLNLIDVPKGVGNDVLSYAIIKLATYPDCRELLQQIIETKVKENDNEENDNPDGE